MKLLAAVQPPARHAPYAAEQAAGQDASPKRNPNKPPSQGTKKFAKITKRRTVFINIVLRCF